MSFSVYLQLNDRLGLARDLRFVGYISEANIISFRFLLSSSVSFPFLSTWALEKSLPHSPPSSVLPLLHGRRLSGRPQNLTDSFEALMWHSLRHVIC
jgi:hypothetical protein